MGRVIVWTVKEVANMIKNRQKDEYDVVITIDGNRGNGKSTLAYQLLKKTGKFKPEKDIMFTRDDVMEAMKTRKFSCIDADEMINSAHNRDFFSGDQKNFIKIVNMYRDNHNILVGAVPFFYDLDTQIRKLVKMRITVIKRGVAIIQVGNNSLYGNDPWETNINKKIEESWVNKLKMGKPAKPQYQKLTTYAGHLFFGKLNEKQEKIYKGLKVQKRSELKLDSDEKIKKGYWQVANEHIETGKIRNFKELRFFLLGKDILYTKGLSKINTYRKDLGFRISLREKFGEEKNKRFLKEDHGRSEEEIAKGIKDAKKLIRSDIKLPEIPPLYTPPKEEESVITT